MSFAQLTMIIRIEQVFWIYLVFEPSCDVGKKDGDTFMRKKFGAMRIVLTRRVLTRKVLLLESVKTLDLD